MCLRLYATTKLHNYKDGKKFPIIDYVNISLMSNWKFCSLKKKNNKKVHWSIVHNIYGALYAVQKFYTKIKCFVTFTSC